MNAIAERYDPAAVSCNIDWKACSGFTKNAHPAEVRGQPRGGPFWVKAPRRLAPKMRTPARADAPNAKQGRRVEARKNAIAHAAGDIRIALLTLALHC